MRFRSLRELTWHPEPGVNVLIGPGDVGKTAILDAIELALTPAVVQGADETDYTDLDVASGFTIELLVGALSEEVKASVFMAPLWGWDRESRELHYRPRAENADEEVLKVSVRGTPDLEVVHEIVPPGAAERRLSVQQRASLSMWSVGVGRSPEAELRMRRGALLERALGGDKLRGTAVQAFRGLTDNFTMPEESSTALERVRASLDAAGIPTAGLGLGVVSTRGQSPVATFGLVVDHGSDAKMPFGSFGRGTQQLAMVALAAARAAEGAIAVADEIETGLEPYRQRQLFGMLRGVVGTSGQAFITTHSPTVLGSANVGEVWRVLGGAGAPTLGHVEGRRVSRLLKSDPSAFFAPLVIVGEGVTEVGLLRHLLREFARAEDKDVDGLGIHIVDGTGHEETLALLEELHSSGHTVMGFVDNEVQRSGTRESLIGKGIPLHVDKGARNLEHAVALALPNADALEDFIGWAGKETAPAFPESRCQQVGELIGKPGKARPTDLIASGFALAEVQEAIASAAHKHGWFKSLEAGMSLGQFVEIRVPRETDFFRGIVSFWEEAKKQLRVSEPKP